LKRGKRRTKGGTLAEYFMRYTCGTLAFIAVLTTSNLTFAQTQSGPPAGATALCKDNTYYTGSSHRGACARHGGIQQWLAAGPVATPGSTREPTPHSTSAPESTPTTNATQQYPRRAASPTMTNTGNVWVNTASRVYHCPNDRWYGKTGKGEYMSEAQAKAQGFRADHNRPCPI